MAKKAQSAWDDDWEAQADNMAAEDAASGSDSGGVSLVTPAATSRTSEELSPAERLARHKEENRRLWQSADQPEEFHFLAVGSNHAASVSPAAPFRPAMKVLSRKPAPQIIKRRDPVTGLEQLTIRDDAAEAEAEAAAIAARNQLSPEQIRQRQQRELEEKQRKYDAARAKIFGEPLPKSGGLVGTGTGAGTSSSAVSSSGPTTTASSRQTSPKSAAYGGSSGNSHSSGSGSGSSNSTTPPNAPSSSPYHGSGHHGRGRGRGRGGGGAGYRGDGHGRQHDYNRRYQQQQQSPQKPQQQQYQQQRGGGGAPPSLLAPTSAPAQATTTAATMALASASMLQQLPPARELFDPNYTPKPHHARRPGTGGGGGNGSGSDSASSPQPSRSGTPREDDYIIRSPRGPDSSGRGGFARRGAR